MQDDAIITNGAMMLRFQQAGMVFMSITLVSTCVCQSVGSAAGSFALSISRQGVLYVIVLFYNAGCIWLSGRAYVTDDGRHWNCSYGSNYNIKNYKKY